MRLTLHSILNIHDPEYSGGFFVGTITGMALVECFLPDFLDLNNYSLFHYTTCIDDNGQIRPL